MVNKKIICFLKLIQEEGTRTSLKNCSVVIDGHNFFYDRYKDSELPFIFGCEANIYANYLRHLLDIFKQANVKCYFIFKGGNKDINKKVKKYQKRFDFQANYQFSPPLFLTEVCKQVLEEESHKYATCVVENKDCCVAVAQKLDCPLISNDSEFCFRRSAYILSRTLSFDSTRNCIECKEYNLKDFLHNYSLTERKFAIFATLSDILTFPEGHVKDLLETWGVYDINKFLQNKKLLKWLSKHTEDEILDKVSKFLNEDQNKTFLVHIQKFLNDLEVDYNDDESVVGWGLFNDCRYQVTCRDPLWFEKGVAAQNIPVPYINLYKHNKIESSWDMLSIEIIKYAFNLLTNFKTNHFFIYQNADATISTMINAEYIEDNRPKYTCVEWLFEDGWQNVQRLKLFEHFLTMNNIDTKMIDDFPIEARMLFITLLYFERKKKFENMNVKKQIYCCIISYVLLHIVFDNKDSITKKNSGINEKDAAEAVRVTEHYFKMKNDEAKEIFDENEVKIFKDLQNCLLHMNYLNTLCGSTYTGTIYHRTYNGTFIYKLFQDMKRSSNNHFIDTLFNNAHSVRYYVNMLIKLYNKVLRATTL